MSRGTGAGDLEVRVLNLERKAYSPELANIEARLAALEQGRFQQPGGGGSPAAQFSLAVLGAALGPGSMTAPASGSAALQSWNGSAFTAGQTVTVNSDHDKTIASGAMVKVATDALGYWWVVDVWSCTALS